MDFYERLSMRPVLWTKLHALTGDAFQGFFHDLMTCADPAFVDVRTHGNIGDLASDGLSLNDRRLYACYAPETPDASKTVSKFNSDLAGLSQSVRASSTPSFSCTTTPGEPVQKCRQLWPAPGRPTAAFSSRSSGLDTFGTPLGV